jgi:hypothetical protein
MVSEVRRVFGAVKYRELRLETTNGHAATWI